jgi:hypothetical protein
MNKPQSLALLANTAFTGGMAITNIFLPRVAMYAMLKDSVGSKTAFSSDEYHVLSGLLGAVSLFFSFFLINISQNVTLAGLQAAGWANLIIAVKGLYNIGFFYDHIRYTEMIVTAVYALFGVYFLLSSSPAFPLSSIKNWTFSGTSGIIGSDMVVTMAECFAFFFLHRTATWMFIKGYPFTLTSANDEKMLTTAIAAFFLANTVLVSHFRAEPSKKDVSWLMVGHWMYVLGHAFVMFSVPSSRTIFQMGFLLKDVVFGSLFTLKWSSWDKVPIKSKFSANRAPGSTI